VKTGDDVAIKLVSREDAIQFIPAIGQWLVAAGTADGITWAIIRTH
jgi:hypothetical protein